ncbi:MAG: carboxylesterase [Gammaproteobacteria bacterium]|nr:carboxylesterase [Gammaproteobacteria bacterium]|tara:strand:- start:17886 stop:19550 length:1665 start_codon:yes stop_codon:yes gene_type:complete
MKRRKFIQVSQLPLASGMTAPWIWTPARAQADGPGSIVDTTSGLIQGYISGGVEVFRGVPYGEATYGANRFMPPQEKRPWTGVRLATVHGTRSPQPYRPMIPEIGDALTGSGAMGEDNLKLNVWTSSARPGDNKPVFIWFHGGGFRTGSGNSPFFDGEQLARYHDMVVVTVTHRLNALGFMYLADAPDSRYSESSNMGMQDILLALKWVNQNIENFGGNPNNVTIGGQSGGGGKSSILQGMPEARGLFHKAVVMATIIETAVTALEPEEAVHARDILLNRLGLSLNNLERLHDMPFEVLIRAMGAQAGGGPDDGDIALRFVPVKDDRILQFHPFSPQASPISTDIPLILGSNETEGVPYGNPNDKFWESEPGNMSELLAEITRSHRISENEARELIDLYRRNRPNASYADLALYMQADIRATSRSAEIIAEAKLRQGTAPVYMYYFNWNSPVRYGKLRSMHCMEVPFFFDNIDKTDFMTGRGREQYRLSWDMAQAWSAYTHTGNPSHDGIGQWAEYELPDRATMIFGNNTRMVNDPYSDERIATEEIIASWDAE